MLVAVGLFAATCAKTPTEAEYYGAHGLNPESSKPWKIPRFSNITRVQFDELVVSPNKSAKRAII